MLLVEDDPQMQRYLRTLLRSNGYALHIESRGAAAIAAVAQHQPDVILLDLGLPDLDGVAVTQRLREWTTTPIVVLTARHLDRDKVEALDAGADDYLTKPFSSRELLARVRVALRHVAQRGSRDVEPVFECGDVRVDHGRRLVTGRGEAIKLTPIEYRLLAVLTRHAGKVLTHRQILRDVWGPKSAGYPHYVRVYMLQLRRKLERDPARPVYLLTESGVG
ncbi:MAG TPA: response regulator, partial [Kofleriaceae bacterium]|nr:response regulator [Kofleriaceae bacterium]